MSKLVFVLMVVSLATALGGDEVDKKAATSEPSATPMMVSFTELKWTELPERKGMQFAGFRGTRSWASTPRFGRSPLELIIRSTPIAVKSRM